MYISSYKASLEKKLPRKPQSRTMRKKSSARPSLESRLRASGMQNARASAGGI